jgi:DNA modification methylase
MVNPKRNSNKNNVTPAWYDYYAGYSDDFLIHTLKYLNLDAQATILDPWNGTGTTTFQAHKHGYKAIGIDINPALIIIAKARNLNRHIMPSIDALTLDIIKKTSKKSKNSINEPYSLWFTPATALFLRSLERAIYSLLVSPDANLIFNLISLDSISSLASFFYVALFQTVKSYLQSFATSNPTWIKTAKNHTELVSADCKSIESEFIRQIEKLKFYIETVGTNNDEHFYSINLGKSENLSLETNSIDAVITSPPYCTRIDYAIATLPELATLGFNKDKQFKEFRNSIIGTPTIHDKNIPAKPQWGENCLQLLKNISNHESKASKTYYSDYFLQYFHNLYLSSKEITRVCKDNAQVAIVTQDSYYKEIHVNLPSIISDFFEANNWEKQEEKPFITQQTMTKVNKQTKKYRQTTEATETISVFRKK